MTIFGGSESVENFAFQRQWDPDGAYIMSDPSDAGFKAEDIGIAVLSYKRPKNDWLFNKDILMDKDALGKAVIVPICMVAKEKDFENNEFINTEFRGFGWGRQYDEAPTTDPIYSSCMTSPASPFFYRYQNCDLKVIQKNNWLCNTAHDHPGFEPMCNFYRKQFERNKHSLQRFWSKLRDIDIVYIIDGYGKTTTCYYPLLMKERGWCYLDSPTFDPSTAKRTWGTCSLSCSDQLKAVYV